MLATGHKSTAGNNYANAHAYGHLQKQMNLLGQAPVIHQRDVAAKAQIESRKVVRVFINVSQQHYAFA